MPNTVNYFEIGSPDPSRSREFYGGLFGWEIGPAAEPSGYAMMDGDRGGLWDTGTLAGENWAIFYVQVDDVRAAFEQAQELGAAVAVPIVDNGRIEFAHLLDPLGNRFGIWQPKA